MYRSKLIHLSNSLGLGENDGHPLTVWNTEVSHASENQVGEYATVSNGDLVRRTTVGDESPRNKASHLNASWEADGRAGIASVPSGSHLGHRQSNPTLRRVEIPISASSSRETVATLLSNVIPPSAASTMTLFEFEAGLGPQAESTPLDDQRKKHPTSKKAPPRNRLPTPHTRRSSIVYIKPDDDSPANSASPRSFSQTVRQLVPKRNLLQRMSTKPGPPGGVLRPLSLLQGRDTNRQVTSPGRTQQFFPEQRQQLKISDDENDAAQHEASPKKWNFKQLQLTRSETSKQRGVLRASERLTDGDLRPQSTEEQSGIVYGYAR